ncbi:MAG: hypothetical protein LBV78_02195, partial [Kitasatospora sp.]|nr:hypothetical protein [Kitasatospora sp.]
SEHAQTPVVTIDQPQPGLPRLDVADDWPGTVRITTLHERALTYARLYAAPVLAIESAGQASSPPLTAYGPGDDVTVLVVTPLLTGGLEVTGQLAGVSINAGDGAADWTVTAALPPPRPREAVAPRLDRIDRTIKAARHSGLAPVP